MTAIRARWKLAGPDSQRLTTAVAWRLAIYVDGQPVPGVTVYSPTQPTEADARRIVRRLRARGYHLSSLEWGETTTREAA